MAECQLSVVVPCHNCGRYLKEAVDSVLNQRSSVQSLEILIVDDHSDDKETLAALNSLASQDSRIRVLKHSGKRGISGARNIGVEAARGEWIAFLDADDVWLPDSLQSRWKVVERETQAEWISADVWLCDEGGSILAKTGHFESGEIARKILYNGFPAEETVKLVKPVREFLRSSLAWTGAVMAKRSLLLRVGGFDLNLKRAEDMHLWIRLARETDYFFVPKPVALYRQHIRSISRENAPPESWSITAYLMLMKLPEFKPYLDLARRRVAYFHSQNAYYHRGRGEMREAFNSALASVWHSPLSGEYWKNLLAITMKRL